MSTQISSQATKLWQIISAPKTLEAYQQAIAVTWQILKETALLVWLTICLVLVLFDWLGTTAVTTGHNVKNWFNSLKETSSDQIASETGKAILTVGKTGIASTVALAREQLGLPEKPALPKPEPTPAKPASAPATSVVTPVGKPEMSAKTKDTSAEVAAVED
jgi:hypothetical protein